MENKELKKFEDKYMINITQVLGMMKQISKLLWMKKNLKPLQLEK